MRPNRLLTLRIPFSGDRYKKLESRNAFLKDVLNRVATVPGVIAVGLNSGLPPIGNWTLPATVDGSTEKQGREVVLHQTNPGYMLALGVSLRAGRFLSEGDMQSRIHNAVVNQAFARRYFGSSNPLGRIVHLPRLLTPPAQVSNDAFQIVGVVKDTVNDVATQQKEPELYIPFTILPAADRLYVASSVRPDTLERSVRQQVYAADPGQPVTDVRSLDSLLDEWVYAQPRFNLLLFGVFATLGLAMALIGVYGVISNGVAQRRREIGIRFALGAKSGQVVGLILQSGARLLLLGVVAGSIGSFLAARLLTRMVHNVSPFDPYSFIGAVLLLLLTGLSASLWPARRASRIDPVEALRQE